MSVLERLQLAREAIEVRQLLERAGYIAVRREDLAAVLDDQTPVGEQTAARERMRTILVAWTPGATSPADAEAAATKLVHVLFGEDL